MKSLKEVLEELCVKVDNRDRKDFVFFHQLTADAITQIEGMVPAEIEIPIDVCGVKVTIAEAYGFNACRQAILTNFRGKD